MREDFSVTRLCRATTAYWNLLAVDGRYRPLPACQGFFEIQFDGGDEVIVLALEKRVVFLQDC